MLHTTNPVIKHNIGLLSLVEELNYVSKACKSIGGSCDTFYYYYKLDDEGGVDSLINVVAGTLISITVKAPLLITVWLIMLLLFKLIVSTEPAMNCIKGYVISECGVFSVSLRHNFENLKKHLKALKEQVARDGIELTHSQIAVLERKASNNKVYGEIETTHLGYLGTQYTFYVGSLTRC